jgi:hypothetical protein
MKYIRHPQLIWYKIAMEFHLLLAITSNVDASVTAHLLKYDRYKEAIRLLKDKIND